MSIIGCDYHPDSSAGKQRLGHPEQAGQHATALPVGGGGASGGALRSAVAAAFCAPCHAAATQRRHRRHGAQVGREFVRAVAQRRRSAGRVPVRFAGSKTLLSYCRDQGFDLVAEAAQFPDHSISAVSS